MGISKNHEIRHCKGRNDRSNPVDNEIASLHSQ